MFFAFGRVSLAGFFGSQNFAEDIELEAYTVVLLQDTQLFPFPSCVKIQGIILIPEAKGYDIWNIVLRHGESTHE